MKTITTADWSRIRLFAMDVDGVLTDGTVSILSNGIEGKNFSILDGLGLKRLASAGVVVAWISGRFSEATSHRATELDIPHLFQGGREKREILKELAEKIGCQADEVCYMGDDVVDLRAMDWAGIAVSVPNGVPSAQSAAQIITQQAGGLGAVREICDQILEARNS